MSESLIETLNNNSNNSNNISNITNMEQTNVKDVYEKIAAHFSNTRVYSWSWIIEFLEEISLKNETYDNLNCINL